MARKAETYRAARRNAERGKRPERRIIKAGRWTWFVYFNGAIARETPTRREAQQYLHFLRTETSHG